MTNYRKRFLTMFDEIKSCTNIDIISAKSEIPQTSQSDINFQFSEIETYLGYKLDETLKECFLGIDEISLYWGYELDDIYENGGEFRLINLSRVFTFSRPKLWYEEMEEQEKEFYKKLIPIDDHPNTGDGVMGVFKLEDGVASPEIFLYDSNGQCHKMDLDYKGYLENLLQTKGFYGWQYFFCDIDLSDYYFSDVNSNLNKILQVLPKLFPNTDYSQYFEIYEQKKKGK